jgi:hypothetical protein
MTKIVPGNVVAMIKTLIDQDTEMVVRTGRIAARLKKELPNHDLTDVEIDGLVLKACALAERPVEVGD